MGSFITVTNVTELRAETRSSIARTDTALDIELTTSDGMSLYLFAWFHDATLATEYADVIRAVNERRKQKGAA